MNKRKQQRVSCFTLMIVLVDVSKVLCKISLRYSLWEEAKTSFGQVIQLDRGESTFVCFSQIEEVLFFAFISCVWDLRDAYS